MVVSESSQITTVTRIRTSVAQRVIALQHIACAIVCFNIVYSLAMFLLSPGFAILVLQFPAFAIFCVISSIAALFAIKDKRAVLLYPILVAEIPLILVSLSIWLFHLINIFYCVFLNHSSKANPTPPNDLPANNKNKPFQQEEELQQNFLSCSMAAVSYADHQFILTPISIFSTIIFFLVFLKSLLEFLVIRRLLKMFQAVAEERRRNLVEDVLDNYEAAADRQQHKSKKMAESDDDDDMVVYEKINRQLQFKDNSRLRDHSSHGLPPTVSSTSRPSLPTLINSKRTLE